jgi:hypothetical protein
MLLKNGEKTINLKTKPMETPLFNEEFKQRTQADKIKSCITDKNTPFDKIRQRMLKEILSN